MEKKLSSDPELSQFYGMIENNEAVDAILKHFQCTLFAPTNLAFQGIDPKQNPGDYLLSYHISNTPAPLRDLETSITVLAQGNPPLWISRVQNNYVANDGYAPKNYTKYDMYVNNARINMERSDFMGISPKGKTQVLHVIEEVLQPLTKKNNGSNGNPTAYQFLEQHQDYNIGPYSVGNFWNLVKKADKQSLYGSDGRFTFFVPVDSMYQVADTKNNKIDGKVIDGHIVQGSVLFTNPTPENNMYKTLAFTDLIKVFVSIQSERSKKPEMPINRYVTSKTIVGDKTHPDGAVLANIVRANIPVKNGVVHLINRPLMVVDDTVIQFLEREKDGFLSEFLAVLRSYGNDLMTKLSSSSSSFTIFAPINDAWKDNGVQMALKNETLMRDIVNLHVVQNRYATSAIREKNSNEILSLANQKLYFNVIPRTEMNYTVTVEGGGTNATIIHADIAATNGIIHVIDRVLGIPCSTIESKLASDPQLNLTYTLGKEKFNGRLNKSGNYTYFVPRDHAWNALNIKYPTLYKILFAPESQYQVTQILERHLIADGAFTMADLKNITSVSNSVPAFRDHLNIRVKESTANKGYAIQWLNDWVNVYRSDIRCTNGIIHIIDEVLLMDSDIKVVGGSVKPDALNINVLLCVILSMLFATLYH